MVCLALGCGGGGETTAELGILVGRVETIDDIPVDTCEVNILGTPLGVACSTDGIFRISGVPTGDYTVRVSPTVPELGFTDKAFQIKAGENQNVGVVQLKAPGSVAGFYTPSNGLDPAMSLVAVDDGDGVTRPSGGQYMIQNVAAGGHRLALIFGTSFLTQMSVPVTTGNTTNIDFDLLQGMTGQGQLSGVVTLVSGDPTLVTVDLIRLPGTAVVTSAQPNPMGEFQLIASSGCYLVSAHRDGSATQSVRQVILLGGASKDLGTLVVFDDLTAFTRATDADGNGIPDGLEPMCATL